MAFLSEGGKKVCAVPSDNFQDFTNELVKVEKLQPQVGTRVTTNRTNITQAIQKLKVGVLYAKNGQASAQEWFKNRM